MSLTNRMITPEDFELFSKWSLQSGVDIEDVQATLRNRTTFVIVTCESDTDGAEKVICFTPVYAVARIGFVAFNPEATIRERVAALPSQVESIKKIVSHFGLDDIYALGAPFCPIARWCSANGFEPERRTFLVMKDAKSHPPSEAVIEINEYEEIADAHRLADLHESVNKLKSVINQ